MRVPADGLLPSHSEIVPCRLAQCRHRSARPHAVRIRSRPRYNRPSSIIRPALAGATMADLSRRDLLLAGGTVAWARTSPLLAATTPSLQREAARAIPSSREIGRAHV